MAGYAAAECSRSQYRRAIVKLNGPSGRAAELRSYGCGEGHRLPIARGILRGSQSDRRRGFPDNLLYYRRVARSKVRVSLAD